MGRWVNCTNHTHTHARARARTHAHTHTRERARTNTHTHTHTRTHTQIRKTPHLLVVQQQEPVHANDLVILQFDVLSQGLL